MKLLQYCKTATRSLLFRACAGIGALLLALSSGPLSAAKMIGDCEDAGLSLTVLDCVGFKKKDLLDGHKGNVKKQEQALAKLGFDFDGNFDAVADTMVRSDESGNWVLPGPIYGITYIGISVAGDKKNKAQTAFFMIEGFGETNFTMKKASNSPVIFYTNRPVAAAAVPEPSTWALLLLGFAGIGTVLRQRPAKRKPALRL